MVANSGLSELTELYTYIYSKFIDIYHFKCTENLTIVTVTFKLLENRSGRC